MQSGKLRYLVAIEEQTSSKDGFGAEQPLWDTVALVYAGFETLNGQELSAAQTITPDVTHKISIRFRAGITAKMRVNWTDTTEGRNRIFDIIAPMDPDQRRQQMTLLAVERNVPGDGSAPGAMTGFPSGYGRKAFNEAPDGARTVFTLPGIPNPAVFRFVLEGLEQAVSQYQLVGNTMTLQFAPQAGDEMTPWY
ncbi:MAG TPA: phage head closure protein [Candidatus Angelobacter sp.]|jgi:SPP1 family predicted phage head-tail adaptor